METDRLSTKGYRLVVLAVVFLFFFLYIVASVFVIFVISVRLPNFLQGKNLNSMPEIR